MKNANRNMDRKYISKYTDKLFVIEEDCPEVGSYLYVYSNNVCVYDSLQNGTYACMVVALDQYNFPLDSLIAQ